MRFKVKKTHYFSHTVHYCCSSMPRLSETKLIVLRSEACSDWPAIRCVVIGRTPQACDGNVTVLRCVSRRDETKTIKPIINEAFVASSGT